METFLTLNDTYPKKELGPISQLQNTILTSILCIHVGAIHILGISDTEVCVRICSTPDSVVTSTRHGHTDVPRGLVYECVDCSVFICPYSRCVFCRSGFYSIYSHSQNLTIRRFDCSFHTYMHLYKKLRDIYDKAY